MEAGGFCKEGMAGLSHQGGDSERTAVSGKDGPSKVHPPAQQLDDLEDLGKDNLQVIRPAPSNLPARKLVIQFKTASRGEIAGVLQL